MKTAASSTVNWDDIPYAAEQERRYRAEREAEHNRPLRPTQKQIFILKRYCYKLDKLATMDRIEATQYVNDVLYAKGLTDERLTILPDRLQAVTDATQRR